jgi:hypothetical protein
MSGEEYPLVDLLDIDKQTDPVPSPQSIYLDFSVALF